MADKPSKPSDAYTARELWKLMNFYLTKIRNHPKGETVGVIRQIQRLLDKGIEFDTIAQALENYAADDWRKANPRYSRPVRTFFTAESIAEWSQPKPPVRKYAEPFLSFEPSVVPKPLQPTKPEEPEDIEY